LLKDAGSERTLRNWIKQAQGGPGLGRRAGTDNEASDNAADLVAHFAVALGRAKSRRTALLDMVGEDRAQRIQNRNPLKALPELTAAEHEGARQFLFRLLYLMYRERRTGRRVTESDAAWLFRSYPKNSKQIKKIEPKRD
jgi:hypothetical protein